jgi:WD and tetratricopeptide repeat-containing protein 1
VILWSGATGRKLVQLGTEHVGNIFSVKFLPNSGDRALVTGAQDARVCLLDVPRETVVQSAAFHFGRVSHPTMD